MQFILILVNGSIIKDHTIGSLQNKCGSGCSPPGGLAVTIGLVNRPTYGTESTILLYLVVISGFIGRLRKKAEVV